MDNNYFAERYYVWSYDLDKEIKGEKTPNILIAIGWLFIPIGIVLLAVISDHTTKVLSFTICFFITMIFAAVGAYLDTCLRKKKSFMSLFFLISETGRSFAVVNIDNPVFLDFVGLGAYRPRFSISTRRFFKDQKINEQNRKIVSKIVRENNYVGYLHENGTLSQVASYVKSIVDVQYVDDYIRLTYYVNDGKKDRKAYANIYDNIDNYDSLKNMLERYTMY